MKISFFIIFIIMHFIGISQSVMQEYTEAFAGKSIFKHAILSASIVDLESNTEIVLYNEDKSLTPASSLKIITTFTSLFELGADYRFRTLLAYDGLIEENNVLNGNIYIIGGGDPTFGSTKTSGAVTLRNVFKKWYNILNKKGIHCIDGDIISDESVFNSFPICPSWQWNDLGNYYATGAWGLNVYDNEYHIVFQQNNKPNQATTIKRFYPKIWRLKLMNEIVTGKKGSGDNAYIFGGPYDYTKRIVGTIPPGKGEFIIKGAIPDPPLFLAHFLQEYLSVKDIISNDFKTQYHDFKKDRKRIVLDTIFSPPMEAIVRKANLESNNMYCEVLLKKLGKVKRGVGSSGMGKQVIYKFLRRNGIDKDGLFMEDASGLSVRNRVSTRFMTRFLIGIADKGRLEYVTKFLPRAGFSGTLSKSFQKSQARGRIYAKSGSMIDIASYTGYIHAKSGKWYAFSIIVNGFDEKPKRVKKELQNWMNFIYKRG